MRVINPKNEYFLTAVRAARSAGRTLMRYYAREFRVEYKGDLDLITDADRDAETVMLRHIGKAFPEHDILAEESGSRRGGSDFKWIIDPLDGTTNFSHLFPMFCVSIALEVCQKITLGVVYDPLRRELFAAQRGKGATLNGSPIRVSQTKELGRSLLVTGFAYNIRETLDNNLNHFSNFTLRAQGIRRTGTAALDLCYVACGRLDGFWEMNLSPWDTAAGLLILEEAGGTLSDFSNQPYQIYLKQIVATNGRIHNEMIEILKMGL